MDLKVNIAFVFATVFYLLALNSAVAKPYVPGCGCDGFEGGFGYGPISPISSPPISFLPVPQPVPFRVPQPPKQSVTIPNIILALLPPNQKSHIAPRPIFRPPPVVLPLPQPYPLPVAERCGCY